MRRLKKEEIRKFKAGTRSILNAAFEEGIDVYKFIEEERVFLLKKGKKEFWFRGPRLSTSNPVSLWIIKDKYLTKKVLADIGVPFPEGYPSKTVKEARRVARKIGFPLVLKPRRFEGGKGVFLNVNSFKKVTDFFKKSLRYDNQVLLERQVTGKYYRITMVDNKVSGILETNGIKIVGNGKNTIKELINKYNKLSREKYIITEKTRDILLFQNLNLTSVPKDKIEFILGFSGAEGGNWIDKTDEICKENRELLIKLSKYLDLGILGLDLIAKDISMPITSKLSPGYVLEINGAPEFLFHLSPTHGKSRDIGKEIIKMLFK